MSFHLFHTLEHIFQCMHCRIYILLWSGWQHSIHRMDMSCSHMDLLSHKRLLSETLNNSFYAGADPHQCPLLYGNWSVFHKKFFFLENGLYNFFFQFIRGIRNNKILPICKTSSEENGTGQYPVRMTQKPR